MVFIAVVRSVREAGLAALIRLLARRTHRTGVFAGRSRQYVQHSFDDVVSVLTRRRLDRRESAVVNGGGG